MKTNVLAIVNPKAGTIRDKSVLLEDIVPIFDSQTFGFDRLEVVESEGPGHATELSRKAAMEGFGMCLAFGGDGTMNEVAKGLLHSETALGIIPLGSGNGLARHLKISMKPKEAFKQMLTGKTLQMDHGLANGNPFFLAAGLGFEGVVAHAFGNQKSRGFSQYIQSAAKAFFSYKAIRMNWKRDDEEEFFDVFTLTLANGSQYGNNAWISPHSSVCDGILNRVVISDFNVLLGPEIFFRLMTGKLKSSRIYSNQGFKKFALESDQEIIGHIDGEPVFFGNRLDVELVPAALNIRVPVEVVSI